MVRACHPGGSPRTPTPGAAGRRPATTWASSSAPTGTSAGPSAIWSPPSHARPRRRGWWSDEAGRSYLRLAALARPLPVLDGSLRGRRAPLPTHPQARAVRPARGALPPRARPTSAWATSTARSWSSSAPTTIRTPATTSGSTWFYKGEFARSVGAFRRGLFENLHLAARLADLEPPPVLPSYRGTHPQGARRRGRRLRVHGPLRRPLDGAARCCATGCAASWITRSSGTTCGATSSSCARSSAPDLAAGEAARLEGANAALRNPERLARDRRRDRDRRDAAGLPPAPPDANDARATHPATRPDLPIGEHPAPDLGQARRLPVHQDADAEHARRETDREVGRQHEQQQAAPRSARWAARAPPPRAPSSGRA